MTISRNCIVFVFGCLAAFLVLIAVSLSPKISYLFLHSILDDRTYAGNLTRSREIGCNTAISWQPGLLFVGDSHSASSWDFIVAQEKSGKRVGLCTFAGATIGDLADVAEVAALHLDNKPIIVIGLAPRQFWNQKSIEEHNSIAQAQLKAMVAQWNFWANAVVELVFLDPMKSGSYERNQAVHRQLERYFEPSMEKRVTLALKNSVQKHLIRWKNRVEEASLLGGLLEAIDKLCRLEKSGAVKIIATYVPESPLLKAMYDENAISGLVSASRQMSECDITVIRTADNNIVGNRHFLNIGGLTGAEKWFSEDAVENDKMDDMRSDILDADHMNFFGAWVFTSWFFKQAEVRQIVR